MVEFNETAEKQKLLPGQTSLPSNNRRLSNLTFRNIFNK